MKKMRYFWLLPLLCAAALIPVLFGGAFPRLEVAGFRIEQEEYLQAMYQARNQVLSDHAAAGISLTDWNAETPLGDPVALTMERTLDLLREAYAVSTLAVERGYLADAGYDAMLRELEQTLRALPQGRLTDALEDFPQLQAYYQEISIQPGNYGSYDRSHGEVLALAAELQSGQRSGVIRQGARLYLVECLDRTVHSYVPLEDVQSVVAQSIRERRYDALIAARAEQLPVHADPDRLYRFTAAQLP